MPLTHVHLAAGKSLAERTAILDAIHAALVDALRIPAGDRNQILHEDWGIRGGQSAADVELGFVVEV